MQQRMKKIQGKKAQIRAEEERRKEKLEMNAVPNMLQDEDEDILFGN